MDWDDIRVFLAVARSESLVRGAREAGLDRSTASRRIAALETAVGAKVFLRSREGLRLSPAGVRLLAHAERMATEARALAAEAADASTKVAGVVRVATTEALAVFLVDEGLLHLRAEYPELVIELLSGNRPVDLARGEADLALRLSPVREANVQIRKVASMRVALFAAESYTGRRGAPTDVASLRGHDIVLPAGDLANLPETKWLAEIPNVAVAFRSSSMPALISAMAAGVGIGATTEAWGLRVPGLRRLLVLEQLGPRSLWIASAPDASARAPVRVVAARISEILTRVTRIGES